MPSKLNKNRQIKNEKAFKKLRHLPSNKENGEEQKMKYLKKYHAFFKNFNQNSGKLTLLLQLKNF